VATFAWCRDHGILMATTAGCQRGLSDLILEKMGWPDLFVANISSSDVRQGGPHLSLATPACEESSAS
jgi:beta-phosphoglucomutase-like phosphatase (HAD superfamily)